MASVGPTAVTAEQKSHDSLTSLSSDSQVFLSFSHIVLGLHIFFLQILAQLKIPSFYVEWKLEEELPFTSLVVTDSLKNKNKFKKDDLSFDA